MLKLLNKFKQIITGSWEKNRNEIEAILGDGYPDFITRRNPGGLGENIPVFCYHEVRCDTLKSDLEYLSFNGYNTIDADSFLDHIERREKTPPRSVVLTFDDGSNNLFDVAYPLLKSYKMKGVAFIATAFHRDQEDEIFSNDLDRKSPPLSWSKVEEMHKSGVIDFQSHTHSHRYLPQWPKTLELEGSDPYFVESLRGKILPIEEDFKLSKNIIENRLHKKVLHLAFPNFNGTQEAISIGQSLGFRAFWWGLLPNRHSNMPGQTPTRIVRFKSDFIQRLPGKKRKSLIHIISHRFQYSFAKMVERSKAA